MMSNVSWQQRRFRHLNTSYGIKDDTVSEELEKTPGFFERATQIPLRQTLWIKEIFSPAQRRKTSLPIFGKFKNQSLHESSVFEHLEDESYDYRPFFTYWITTVQIAILVCSICIYGVGTNFYFNLGVTERSGNVLASTLSMQYIVVFEQNNIWIGPRFANLVHLGAKYTPCMRADERILRQIREEREFEATKTGCCIADDSCFQTSSCNTQFATFSKITKYDGRQHPVVCGQDPRFCDDTQRHLWTNDISKWPICDRLVDGIPKRERHMHCKISGRPCCIQMHGQCRITTKDYCDFVNGYYHENATLCSQVSCLNEVCGMTPFLRKDRPDQFYRFILPLFIHAGIIRLAITCALQLTIMRRFEKMIGCVRLALIYFVSGVGGYLASASFVPYMPEVGPAGSQGGVLGALIINVVYNWKYLKNPRRALSLHLAVAFGLFLTGFLPYIDNWAQIFGFLFGILMAAALIPYIEFGKCTRFVIVSLSLVITALMFILLFILFYGFPVIDIPLLTMLNCPFTSSKVCHQQGLILRNWLPI